MSYDVETFGRSVFIFDMDGTITESMYVWEAGIRAAASQLGVALPEGFYTEIKTYTSDQVYAWLCENFGMQGTRQEFQDRLEDHVALLYPDVPLKPHIAEALKGYAAKGRVVLLTNTARRLFLPLLERLELAQCFTATWSCKEAGGSKHSATPFLKVLGELGAKPEDAVLFEDSYRYVQVAKELGMRIVGVWEPLSAGDEEDFRAAADLYLRDWADVLI